MPCIPVAQFTLLPFPCRIWSHTSFKTPLCYRDFIYLRKDGTKIPQRRDNMQPEGKINRLGLLKTFSEVLCDLPEENTYHTHIYTCLTNKHPAQWPTPGSCCRCLKLSDPGRAEWCPEPPLLPRAQTRRPKLELSAAELQQLSSLDEEPDFKFQLTALGL